MAGDPAQLVTMGIRLYLMWGHCDFALTPIRYCLGQSQTSVAVIVTIFLSKNNSSLATQD